MKERLKKMELMVCERFGFPMPAREVKIDEPTTTIEPADQSINGEFEVLLKNSDQNSCKEMPLDEISERDVLEDDDLLTDLVLEISDIVKNDEEILPIVVNDELNLLKEFSHLAARQVFDETPSCDLLNGEDGSTEKKLEIDSSLKNDEELIQIEAKAEPIATKELSSLAVRQVFDEMPRRIASYRTSSDVPVLSGVGSFVPMVSEPNLPPSKYDHGKVNPRLHKLILETYIDSVACLELHYFDPGGKGFKLGDSFISNENELVHELVNDEYEHKDIRVGSVSDQKTDLCWHFGANSKHGQAKVALDNVTRVMFDPGGAAYIPSTDLHQARAAILGFEVNQPDLLASEFSQAKVSFTLQKLSLVGENDMFKLPHTLTAQGEMTNGSIRVLCFDPGREEMLFGATSFDSQAIGVKSSNKRDLAVANSWIDGNEIAITQVVKDASASGEMMVFDPGGDVSLQYIQSIKVGTSGKVLALIKLFKSEDFEPMLMWDYNEVRKLLESFKCLNFDFQLQVFDPGRKCSRFNYICEVCLLSTSAMIPRLQGHLQMFIKVPMFLILEDKDPLKEGVL